MENGISTAANPWMIWALMLVSVALVAGITYVYTNRNKRLTLIFTSLSVFSIVLIKLVSIVDHKLHSRFIGAYNDSQIPYVQAYPGWKQLLLAWHIWILPVIFISIFFLAILYSIWNYKNYIKKTDNSTTVLTPPMRTAFALEPKPLKPLAASSSTGSEKLNAFMAMDAAKKEIGEANEKLAEALLLNAAYEIKISDLNMRLVNLDHEKNNIKTQLQEEIEILKAENSAKTRENEYILDQLSERSRELLKTQEMFEELLALQEEQEEDHE